MVLRVVVPTDSVDAASDALWAAGASAVGEASGEVGNVVLTADLDACPPALASFDHDLFDDDGSWKDGWRPFARSVVAGPFLVRPPWVDPGASTAPIELLVDGGHAFGTGSHPSTTLALEALAPFVGRCRSVLDVGCGSGVLAIGAALLGAAPVVAVDVDPAAVGATLANRERNGVAGSVEVRLASADDVDGSFDLVVANLGSPLVVELAEALAARCGDVLVLSGMLADRWDHVPAAYPDFEVVSAPAQDGWRALVLARRSRT